MGPETNEFPIEAQCADNGKRFKAAEGLDFNSLYERIEIKSESYSLILNSSYHKTKFQYRKSPMCFEKICL